MFSHVLLFCSWYILTKDGLFVPTNWAETSSFFLTFSFFSFLFLFSWFLQEETTFLCVNYFFWANFFVNRPFLSSIFSHQKIRPTNLSLCFCSVPFRFTIFSFIIFRLFSFITFSLWFLVPFTFLFISLLLFSLFFRPLSLTVLSLLHYLPVTLSPPPSLRILMFLFQLIIFFSISVFCVFLRVSSHSFLTSSWPHSCFLPSTPYLFFVSPIFCHTKSKIYRGQF